MPKTSCAIHDSKPIPCGNFPQTARMLESVTDKCGYSFDADGVRHGECSRCGACCEEVWLQLPGYDVKTRGERCPYLVVND